MCMGKHTDKIDLRLPPELRDEVERAAAAEGRSISNMTRRIIQAWAAQQQAAA
jgi:uncharacterized protein (DUF1778 family)